MPDTWHVLTTRPSVELSTAARLALAGFRALAPVRQVWHRTAVYRRKSLEDAPLLTGYIFVAGPVGDWRTVLNIQGVRGVVTIGGALAAVERGEIERMMRVSSSRRPIEVGDRLTIEAGPFTGRRIEVLAVDEARREVATAVAMLGSLRPLRISVDQLAA
jgi:transcription antitermination factor NusG